VAFDWFRKAFQADVPARKTPVGTSYQARGLTPPPRVGTASDELGSSQPVVLREVVPELVAPFQRISVYGKMMNDAAVDVSMRLYKTPILGAEFFVEPYSDDPVDKEIAEFVWANLAEGMSAPFLNSLEDILHMYEDGFSILEKVYEQREWAPKRKNANTRNYIMLRKLGPRPAATIKEIVYDDNGGPERVVQSAIQSDRSVEDVDLEINKILIFTFNRRGGDLTGRSLLRTAYSHWYYKTHFYKIDAIQKERNSLGVPKGKLLPGFAPSDKEILRTLLRNLRSNEESFMLLTPNVDVEFAEVKSNLVDVLESANHHNTMILLNVLGQFISLGVTQEGGGRATAGTQSDMFMKSLRYVANQIAAEINMYLIPELVVWNYPTKNFPKLAVRNIGETRDLQMFASALANLYAQSVVTSDPETEAWVRRVFDMPSKSGAGPPPSSSGPPAPEPSANGASQTPAKGNVRVSSGYAGKPPGAPQ
jgi:Protein of unknown function (DUF935)